MTWGETPDAENRYHTTPIQTAKPNNVEPLAWLTDVLKRIVSRQTKRNQLNTLLPWNRKPQNDVAPVNFV
jgi:hypothetical protein